MAAHPSPSLPATSDPLGIDPGGIERAIARRMPALMLGALGVLAILWWMAAQPPPGPGWGDPNAPNQQPWPQQGQGQQPARPPPPPPQSSSGCSLCVGLDCGDCIAGIDCVDCLSGLDCGDCISGLDCTCAVASAPKRSCSTNPLRRLAGSSGLLLPLFVMIGWRRRLRSPSVKAG